MNVNYSTLDNTMYTRKGKECTVLVLHVLICSCASLRESCLKQYSFLSIYQNMRIIFYMVVSYSYFF